MIPALYILIAIITAAVAARILAENDPESRFYKEDRLISAWFGTIIGAAWPISIPIGAAIGAVYLIAFKALRP